MDRRTLITAAALAPAALTAPAVAQTMLCAPVGDDAKLLAAFEFYRAHIDTHLSGEALIKQREAERILVEEPAQTIAGLEVKLRTAMEMLVHEKWAAEEALQAAGATLVERSPIDDFAQRLLFRATEDARRLAA